MHTLVLRGVGAISSKVVLLTVSAPEDPVADTLGTDHQQAVGKAHIYRIRGQETRLKRVVHWQPSQQSIGEHESESVSGDIHGGQDSGLVPERVNNVKSLKEEDGGHGVGDASKVLVLTTGHSKVENDPSNETWAKLDKVLDVERRVGRGTESGVELTTKDELLCQGMPAWLATLSSRATHTAINVHMNNLHHTPCCQCCLHMPGSSPDRCCRG